MPQQPQRRTVVTLLLIILILLFVDPSPSGHTPSSGFDEAISTETHALSVLNTAEYGDFDPPKDRWLNLTGFRKGDGYAWPLLDKTRQKAKDHILSACGEEKGQRLLKGPPLKDEPPLPFYRNVSGHVSGQWVRHDAGVKHSTAHPNFTALWPDLAEYHNLQFHRNFSASEGGISISFSERDEADDFEGLQSRGVRAVMSLYSAAGTESAALVLYGLHALETGSIVIVTHSLK
jgi:hypothetical protein